MSMWETPETATEAEAVHEYQRSKALAELETVRRQLSAIGPTLLAIAYFCALACLFLAMLYYQARA